MKHRTVALFFLVGFLLQSTIGLIFNIMGVTPNIVLCLTIIFSFMYSEKQGIVYGIAFGLLQDISFSVLIGPSALIYFFIALLMDELKHFLYRDSILNIFIASSIGTAVYYLLHWFILMIFKEKYSFFYMIKSLPVLLIMHFSIIVIFYIFLGKKSIKHPSDRSYRGINL